MVVVHSQRQEEEEEEEVKTKGIKIQMSSEFIHTNKKKKRSDVIFLKKKKRKSHTEVRRVLSHPLEVRSRGSGAWLFGSGP